MKKLHFLAAALTLGIGGPVRGQDAPAIPSSALGSGANLGQLLGQRVLSGTPANSPFTNGLGQTVRDWTHQGIHGQELSDRIHWLQRMRADEVNERTNRLEQRRAARDDRLRDIREDRRELRDDERRLREDARRVERDRQDLRRDLRDRDRDDRPRDRDRAGDRDRDRDDRSRDRRHDERSRDRDEHAMRDHDPRHDRGDRAARDHDPRGDRDDRRHDRDNPGRRDRDVQGGHDHGHEHGVAKHEDFGKHLGAQGVNKDHHPALEHHPKVSVPKSVKSPAPSGKGKGK